MAPTFDVKMIKERVTSADVLRSHGIEWCGSKISCPFSDHEDRNPSFDLYDDDRRFKCFGCGRGGDCIDLEAALNGGDSGRAIRTLVERFRIDSSHNQRQPQKRKGKLHPTLAKAIESARWSAQKKNRDSWRETGRWRYDDSLGHEFAYVVRFDSQNAKTYRPIHRDGDGWRIGDPAGYWPLYRLPDVMESDEQVIVVEGEKSADALTVLGFKATTSAYGAKSPKKTDWSPLANRNVMLCPDNHEPGERYIHLVASVHIGHHASSLHVLRLPDLEPGQDAYDFIEHRRSAGRTDTEVREEIQKLMDAAPEWTGPAGEIAETDSSGGHAKEGDADKFGTVPDYIEDLNANHAVVMVEGKCCILNEIEREGRPDVTFSTVQDFNNFYSNRLVDVGTNKKPNEIPASRLWMKSSERRQYSGLIFDPRTIGHTKYFNMFRGFGVEPKPGKWNILYDHIYEVVANGDGELGSYLIAWFARIVQDPAGERPGVAPTLRGGQGCGKGALLSQFGKIIGPHFLHLSEADQLTGRFSYHLKDVLFVYADEAFFAGDRRNLGKLKAMITEETIMIEPKCVNMFPLRNHINLALASNEKWMVPAEIDERRFCVIDVSEKRKGDSEYFKKLFEQMNNGGREAMLYDLLRADYSAIDLRQFPCTEGLLEQKIRSMGTVESFWHEILAQGRFIVADEDLKPLESVEYEWSESVVKTNLHNGFLRFCQNHKKTFPSTSSVFFRELKKLDPELRDTRSSCSEGRVRRLIVGDLQGCRSRWQETLGVSINWEDDDQVAEDDHDIPDMGQDGT